jgi:biotin carboxylase
MATLLFVGAGRHQRRAILRVRELGHRVVAVDRNAEAPGLSAADAAEIVDFADIDRVTEVGQSRGVDGVLTVAADRAVPIVGAVSERLELAGIGVATAQRMTHKREMREAFASAGIPQPPFATLRSAEDIDAAVEQVGFPAVLKPVDSGGQRAVFRLENVSQLERDLTEALAESSTSEAIVEEFVDGTEMNGIVVVRGGRGDLLTLSARLRPPGIGFGVGWIHVHPPSIDSDQLARAQEIAVESALALGMQDGIAFPQLIAAASGRVIVVEVAARIPGGQMADLVRHAVGVDLIEVAVRQALGEEVPDELALPRFSQPLAIRFLTAAPGPLPTGRVTEIGPLDPVLAAEGVVQAETYLELGETIRPVRRDGDRRGYVIAVADSPREALRRAEHAASLLEVEVEA